MNQRIPCVVSRDLARYENQIAREDRLEAARERAIEDHAEALLDLTLRQVMERFWNVSGMSSDILTISPTTIAMMHAHGKAMVRVDMEALVYAMAETEVDAETPDHDPGECPEDNQ